MSGPAAPRARRPRTGRPRADSRPLERPPREEIVAVASRLFGERGVAATTMSEIAQRSGLRQSSVYYYFRDKEQILEEILVSANRVILDHLDRVNAEGGAPGLRLYRLIRLDARQLCEFPYDINEIYRLSSIQEQRFQAFWRERRTLNDRVEELVAEGVATGELVSVDPRLATLALLGNDEGIQNWYRPMGAQGALGDDRYRPEQIATFMADLALRGLLRNRRGLAALRREARRLDP